MGSLLSHFFNKPEVEYVYISRLTMSNHMYDNQINSRKVCKTVSKHNKVLKISLKLYKCFNI